MAIRDFGERPFGLVEAVVTEASGGKHALLAERVFVFTPQFDSDLLEGGDVVVEVGSKITHYTWELEEGGIPIPLYVALIGGTISAIGVTNYFHRLTGTSSIPYFKLEGRALAPDGGDVEVELPKCKVTGGMEGRLEKGQFYVTSCSGVAIKGDASPYIMAEIQQKAAEAAIS